jgi:hypothetical protein
VAAHAPGKPLFPRQVRPYLRVVGCGNTVNAWTSTIETTVNGADGGNESQVVIHIAHVVADVRARLSARGVYGLVREEVDEPVGNALNDTCCANWFCPPH